MANRIHACFCVGPQNGQPLCPCRMRNVQINKGHYIEVIDYGPVHDSQTYDTLWNSKLYDDKFWDSGIEQLNFLINNLEEHLKNKNNKGDMNGANAEQAFQE